MSRRLSVIRCRPRGVAQEVSHYSSTIARLARACVLELLARFCEWRERCIEEEVSDNLEAGVRIGPGYLANSISQARWYEDQAAEWRSRK